MASKKKSEKEELLNALDASRRNLSADFSDVSQTLNVSRRFKESVRDHSLKWVGGGLLAGVLIAMLSPRRRKTVKEKAKRGLIGSAIFGLLGVCTKQILRSALPNVQTFAQEQLQQWLAARQSPSTPQENADEFENY